MIRGCLLIRQTYDDRSRPNGDALLRAMGEIDNLPPSSRVTALTGNQEEVLIVLANGRLIGFTEPCAETKGGWWQVYAYESKIVAMAMEHPCGIRLMEPVPRYVESLTDATHEESTQP